MSLQLWGGRFSEGLDDRVLAFTSSFAFDVRLLPYDLQGSLAHAHMLAAVGILSQEECARITAALQELLAAATQGPPPIGTEEDVHSWVENRLREKVGDLAGKLHTARSRNDQVALDLRLYLRDAVSRTIELLHSVRETLVTTAEKYPGAVMPGFTHLQPAQPVLLAHHLLAYYEMFTRDAGRFADAGARGDELPLGAGALAGTSLPIDRAMVAAELGFARVAANSMDAVGDRDFPLEFLAAAALTMMHLSRLAEEIVLWANPLFGFVELPDRLATGSSMMPQKKNPDVAELVRGKGGRVTGHLVGLLMVMKGLPLTYSRDLQEDKEALFDGVETLHGCLDLMTLLLLGMRFIPEKMTAAAGIGQTTATDLAEYLVRKGMPFREAHGVVGAVVREAIEHGVEIGALPLATLRRHSQLIDDDAAAVLTVAGSVAAKRSAGSTAPALVAEAVQRARATLNDQQDR